MAAIGAEDPRVRPLEHRLADAMRVPEPIVWFVVTLTVIAICAVWHTVTGAWVGLSVGGVPFWLTSWRLEIVFAAIIGYVFACGTWIVRSVRADLDALAPALAVAGLYRVTRHPIYVGHVAIAAGIFFVEGHLALLGIP